MDAVDFFGTLIDATVTDEQVVGGITYGRIRHRCRLWRVRKAIGTQSVAAWEVVHLLDLK